MAAEVLCSTHSRGEALLPFVVRDLCSIDALSELPLSAGHCAREKKYQTTIPRTHFTDGNGGSGRLGTCPGSPGQFEGHVLLLCYALHMGPKCQLFRFSLDAAYQSHRCKGLGVLEDG